MPRRRLTATPTYSSCRDCVLSPLGILLLACLASAPVWADSPRHGRAVATAETVNIAPSFEELADARQQVSRQQVSWQQVSWQQAPWQYGLVRPGAAFLKPHFAEVDLPPGHVLRILDGRGREVEKITGHGPQDRKHFWGLSVPGDRLVLELQVLGHRPFERQATRRPAFRLTKIMVGDAEVLSSFLPSWPGSDLAGAAKSICEPAEFTDAICHQGDSGRWANIAATAGILEIVGDQAFFCTGVNVSPRNLMLTTESCLADTAACENAEFIFGQYREACGSGDVSDSWQSFRCLETVASSPFDNQCEPDSNRLDFSLHLIDGEAAATWGYADPDPTPLSSGEGLYIVQHADGRPLELTEGSGADVEVDGQTLRYFGSLDTESSSVGAPIFRETDDRLVALHHCGGCASPTLGNRGVMMSDIEPLIAPFLCEDSVLLEPVATEAFSPVTGNGDTVLDPGETWQLTPRLLNAACSAGANAISADFQVGTGSAPITLLDTTSTFGNLGAGTSGDGTPIQFTVDVAQPCSGQVVLDLASINSNQGGFSGQDDYADLEIGEVPTSTLLGEDFAAGIPPAWSLDHQGTGDGEGSTWTTEDPGQRDLFPSTYAIVDSEFLGPGLTMDESLISPVIDTTAFSNLSLKFDHHFRWFNGEMDEKADVDIRSSATAGVWTQVLRFQGADALGAEQVDLTAYGAADVQIRFRYFDAEWEWWWAIDNIELLGDNGRVCFTGIFADGFESQDTSAWSRAVP